MALIAGHQASLYRWNPHVAHQAGKDEYSVMDTVQTELGARTMTLDMKTHTIYLSSAKFGPKPEGSRFPPVVPGTFKVLILTQK